MKTATAIEKYRGYMREIRYRTAVIDKTLELLEENGSLTGYRETDLELVFLQLRQCLELMLFASVAAHYSYGHSLSGKFVDKEYNATKLLRYIRKANPKFYPSPVEIKDEQDENGVLLAVPIADGFLTEGEFCVLYDRTCGRLLHANREPKFGADLDELRKSAREYRNKLVRLLNCHWVHLTNETAIRVIMVDSQTGEPSINVMTVLKK